MIAAMLVLDLVARFVTVAFLLAVVTVLGMALYAGQITMNFDDAGRRLRPIKEGER